jgi:hypothetical protein
MMTLRQKVSGDRPRRAHFHGTGRARHRIAALPAREDGEEVRRRCEDLVAVPPGVITLSGPVVAPAGTVA